MPNDFVFRSGTYLIRQEGVIDTKGEAFIAYCSENNLLRRVVIDEQHVELIDSIDLDLEGQAFSASKYKMKVTLKGEGEPGIVLKERLLFFSSKFMVQESELGERDHFSYKGYIFPILRCIVKNFKKKSRSWILELVEV
jgi:hypothetical protein